MGLTISLLTRNTLYNDEEMLWNGKNFYKSLKKVGLLKQNKTKQNPKKQLKEKLNNYM